jgi:small subunit ribosomal protein S7e
MTIAGKEGPLSKLLVKRHQGQQVVEPTALDQQVAKAIYDLQNAGTELGAELQVLQIYGARQVDLSAGRKALVVLVPVPQLKSWRRIQLKVTRELEKKFSEQTVVLVGHRRIAAPPKRGQKVTQMRPRTRTLTTVHENWLEDMVYPTEIVGKRLRVKTDGSRTLKVLLDAKDKAALDAKVDAFGAVYRKLTGKNVVFDFATVPSAALAKQANAKTA